MVQAHIFFKGMVQGVGFRYTAQGIASQLGLKGWVRNVPDGGVEILLEGKKDVIEEFRKQLGQHFQGYIKSQEINFSEASQHFNDFRITY